MLRLNTSLVRAVKNGGYSVDDQVYYYDAFIGSICVGRFSVRPSDQTLGHIGYEVFGQFRGLGIGLMIGKLAVKKCKQLGIKDIKICCRKDNKPSLAIIKHLGGKLVAENRSFLTFVIEE